MMHGTKIVLTYYKKKYIYRTWVVEKKQKLLQRLPKKEKKDR